MNPRRKFTQEFKHNVIEEVQSGMIVLAEALRKYEINSSRYYYWKAQYDRGMFNNEPTAEGVQLNRIAELERKVGQQAMEIDLLKKVREAQFRRISAMPSNIVITGPSKRGAR